MPINPVDTNKLVGNNKNLYEAITVLGKRARMINDQERLELEEKLSQHKEFSDSDEEVEINHEVIKISLEYELRPKPTVNAIHEKLKNDIEFHYAD